MSQFLLAVFPTNVEEQLQVLPFPNEVKIRKPSAQAREDDRNLTQGRTNSRTSVFPQQLEISMKGKNRLVDGYLSTTPSKFSVSFMILCLDRRLSACCAPQVPAHQYCY